MSERLAALIDELTEQNAPPSLTTCLRIASACRDDIAAITDRLNAVDPVTRRHVEIRPLAVVEREAIEMALRQLGDVEATARALEISPATIYRRLREWRGEAVGIEASPATGK